MLSPPDFDALDHAEKDRLQQVMDELKEELRSALSHVPLWQSELRQRIRELDAEVAGLTVAQLAAELERRYEDLPAVLAYLAACACRCGTERRSVSCTRRGRASRCRRSMLHPLSGQPAGGQRRCPGRTGGVRGQPQLPEPRRPHRACRAHGHPVDRFHADPAGCAASRQRRLPGAGRRKAARSPLCLGRAQAGAERRGDPHRTGGAAGRADGLGIARARADSAADLKVALVGDRELYYLLKAYDPDFGPLFKVVADFSEDMPRARRAGDGLCAADCHPAAARVTAAGKS